MATAKELQQAMDNYENSEAYKRAVILVEYREALRMTKQLSDNEDINLIDLEALLLHEISLSQYKAYRALVALNVTNEDE